MQIRARMAKAIAPSDGVCGVSRIAGRLSFYREARMAKAIAPPDGV